ncbi:MAG: hypothetical protein OEZ34_13325 [Spirochaetia bacterium]|nr:hypothetical protein [Spirochaetia bacterium]
MANSTELSKILAKVKDFFMKIWQDFLESMTIGKEMNLNTKKLVIAFISTLFLFFFLS